MAPVYKLKFFNFMGVAEPIRYLFAFGGISYKNIEIEDADWPDVQKSVPFGKLPVLEVDKKVLYQSVAISRYLGKLVGLLPSDDLEAAELDAIALTVFDFGTKVHEWYHEQQKEKKLYLQKELEERWCPRYLGDLEEIVKQKGTYFGGQKLSWTDLYFVGIMESIEGMWGSKILEKQYPSLYIIYKHVHEIPAIETYVSNRPHYKY
ncbi:glutathione S-transferase [Helicoverpa armigera]|uniref:glutathione S-transferase n=1 Tax=Helicoverpa armigera TaxID=29058 RepID=UPI00308277B4